MSRSAGNLFIIVLSLVSLNSRRDNSEEHLANSKARDIISPYKALFTAPPEHVPSFKIVGGPITGNGDIGLTVSGAPDSQRYWISKKDFWKPGPDFKQCGPSLIGGIDVRIQDLADASYHVEQVLYEPVISSKFELMDNIVCLDARVAATDNVIILELKVNNKPVKVNLDLWAKDGYGSEVDSGREEDVLGVRRRFDSDELMYPSAAAIAMRCLGSNDTSFTLEPANPVTIVASVITNHESETYDTQARKKAAGLNPTEVGRLVPVIGRKDVLVWDWSFSPCLIGSRTEPEFQQATFGENANDGLGCVGTCNL